MRRALSSSTVRSSAWLLSLAVVGVVGSARAAVTWTATFEKGDLSEWTPGINGTKGDRKNVEVLGEQAYRGTMAGKITVHPDDTFNFGQNRVDIQHPSMLTDEGEDSWLSGHYMMPEDAKVRNQIGFYESNQSFQNVMDIWVEPKAGGGTTINFGHGFLGATKVWTGDFSKGVWHQVAIHVHWSTNAQQGSIDLWFDGVKVVNAVKAKTKADNNSLFFQTGLHRKDTEQVTDVIYLDEFIEADSEAEAKIAAPTPLGGSGGSGGASAGGSGGSATSGGSSGAAGSSAGSGGAASGGGAGGALSGGTGGLAGGSAGAPATTGGAPSGGGSGNAGPVAPGTAGAAAVEDAGGCSVSAAASRDGALGLLGLLGLAAFVARRRRAA
jgi:MYXO-CTERM domain-containing protein